MKPKVARIRLSIFFAGLFPPLVLCMSLFGNEVDSRPECVSCFVDQTFEGGVISPAQQFPLSPIPANRQPFQRGTVENMAKTAWGVWWNIADLAPKLCEKESAETSQLTENKQ